ncbi:MAG: hypothetical protein KIH67_002355 [Candidatus Moranbacteria bacterium]|nr:hypothetical protein [Candidatus Moranbacteria bacterium]
MLQRAWEKLQDGLFLFLSPILGMIILLMAISAFNKEMAKHKQEDDP